MKNTQRSLYLFFAAFVAALGGLLFGFDTAVISGTLPFIKPYFQLSDAALGWTVSSLLVGCIIGVAGAGIPGDIFGRRKVLIVAALLFFASSLGTALAEALWSFVAFRFLGGIAVGVASMLSPMYIAEIAPAHIRGRLVSLNQLTIVLGIQIAFFSNYYLSAMGPDSWRWMLAMMAIPAFLFFISLFFVPESPRWLVQKGRVKDALSFLHKTNSQTVANKELNAIRENLSVEEKGSYRALWAPRMRRLVLIGVVLAIFQQITGINTIMYYAPVIFENAGAGIDTALLQTVAIGAVNLIFTLVAMRYIDRLGRRPLLLVGSVGMLVSMVCLSVAFFLQQFEGFWVLFFILLYIASFAGSLGPTIWVFLSEIFPNHLRSRAMSVALIALWIACFVITLAFPVMIGALGGGYTFIIFAFICLLNLWFVFKYIPETRGKSLEQIEREFYHR
jgi:SP family arabinose:H+ symporter-like MFS transporter